MVPYMSIKPSPSLDLIDLEYSLHTSLVPTSKHKHTHKNTHIHTIYSSEFGNKPSNDVLFIFL